MKSLCRIQSDIILFVCRNDRTTTMWAETPILFKRTPQTFQCARNMRNKMWNISCNFINFSNIYMHLDFFQAYHEPESHQWRNHINEFWIRYVSFKVSSFRIWNVIFMVISTSVLTDLVKVTTTKYKCTWWECSLVVKSFKYGMVMISLLMSLSYL